MPDEDRVFRVTLSPDGIGEKGLAEWWDYLSALPGDRDL